MEADWEVEIGPEGPVIDAVWPGFVDLRRFPEQIGNLEEVRRFPALAGALLQLNRPDSEPESCAEDVAEDLSVWTSKCDVWRLNAGLELWDPDEMDADPADCVTGVACYIDLIPRVGVAFAELDWVEKLVRAKVYRIRQVAVRNCRADLVIRRAFVEDQEGLGVSAYLSACGVNAERADEALGYALAAFTNVFHETARSATGP